MSAWLICLIAVMGLNESHRTQERFDTCHEIAVRAEANQYDPVLVVSLAYEESRFHRGAESNVGAQGPMQAMPRFFCPNGTIEDCDLIGAGMKAFGLYQRYDETKEVLCHYASGRVCNDRARAYARRIIKRANRIRSRYAILEDVLGPFEIGE